MPLPGFAPSHPCPERPPQGTPGGRSRATGNGSAVIIMPGGTRIEFRDQLASYVVECATLVDALRGVRATGLDGKRHLNSADYSDQEERQKEGEH